ncbi:MAG: biotin/lipoyl-binding protein [Lentisphaeria bacterium]|nr:biotin/lipoyl-binding protein [Lentisphaeria bacterium]
MTENNLQRENLELKARLQAMGGILRLSHDAVLRPDLKSLAEHIVNSSRPLVQYIRACLVATDGAAPRILAEMSQPEVNSHSEYAENIRLIAASLKVDSPLELSSSGADGCALSDAARRACHELLGEKRRLYVIPLSSPRIPGSKTHPYLWLMEFSGSVPPHVKTSTGLLADEYGSALWSFSAGSRPWKRKRLLRPRNILPALLLLFLAALFTVRVDNNIAAEFVLKPKTTFSAYTKFDAVVRKCHVQDGSRVEAGAVILEYDTERMQFQLAAAEAAFRTADAEYEQESKAAFTDPEKLARVKLLALRREQAAVAIDEAKWFLDHSVVRAPVTGMIALAGGSADKLTGRALRTGEKEFDLFGTDGVAAEIMVHERDSAILSQSPALTLFLHTSPELPIRGEILSIRRYPELTEQNFYSYNIRSELTGDRLPELQVGMRGIARLSGERVKLGYYLFRSLVLWYRGV